MISLETLFLLLALSTGAQSIGENGNIQEIVADLRKELQSYRSQVDDLTAKYQILSQQISCQPCGDYTSRESMVKSKDIDKISKPVLRRRKRQSATADRECSLGQNFRYNELTNTYGHGLPMHLDAYGSKYSCLYQCSLHPECVGVNMAGAEGPSFICTGLSSLQDSTSALNGWNLYRKINPGECIIETPSISFDASISGQIGYAQGQVMTWPVIRGNTTNDLKPDGRFRCPVTGVYMFGMSIRKCNSGSAGDEWMALKSSRQGKIGNVGIRDTLDVQSNQFIVTCHMGEYLWVYSHYDACLASYSNGYAFDTSFWGRLLYLL